MDITTKLPAPLVESLASIGLADLLDSQVARERVGVRFLSLERFAASHGYSFKRRDGNVYGALMLVPASTAPALRIITRSAHAAVHGSRRAG